MTDIGKAIKTARIQKNMNQTELAELAGISTSYLSLIERNKRDPKMAALQKIAAALNIPFVILVFLAADTDDELVRVSPELASKLAHTTFQLIK